MARSVIVKPTAHQCELEILLQPASVSSQAARARMITAAQGIERAVVVLPSWFADTPRYGGPAPQSSHAIEADSLSSARQLLETLAAMHARGIAHVDVLRRISGATVEMHAKPRRRRTVPEADFPLAYHAVPEIGWADWMPRADPRGALQRPGVSHDPYAADVWMAGTALLRSQAPVGEDPLAPLLARMTHAKSCVRPSAEEALAAVAALQRIMARGDTKR